MLKVNIEIYNDYNLLKSSTNIHEYEKVTNSMDTKKRLLLVMQVFKFFNLITLIISRYYSFPW